MNFVYPEVRSIVMAIENVLRLAVYNSAARENEFVGSSKEILSGLVHPEKIRTLLLRYIKTDNILVDFHLNLLLTAV